MMMMNVIMECQTFGLHSCSILIFEPTLNITLTQSYQMSITINDRINEYDNDWNLWVTGILTISTLLHLSVPDIRPLYSEAL